MANATAKCCPIKMQPHKNIMVWPHASQSRDPALCNFRFFPKVKVTMKGQGSESTPHTEAATMVPTKTFMKETPELLQKQEGCDPCTLIKGESLRDMDGNVFIF